MRPIGMPTEMANSIAKSASSIVVGSRSTSSCVTGRECLIDVPRSPLTSWPRYAVNWLSRSVLGTSASRNSQELPTLYRPGTMALSSP